MSLKLLNAVDFRVDLPSPPGNLHFLCIVIGSFPINQHDGDSRSDHTK